MKALAIVGVLVAIAIAYVLFGGGANDVGFPKPKDKKSYDQGYEDGYHDGWAETCNKIDGYKESMGKALAEADICPR